MKNTNRAPALASALLVSAMATGPVLADVTLEEVRKTVASVESTGNVQAHLKDGVVLLEGYVEDVIEKQRIEAAMLQLDGVADVQNNILVSD